MQRKPTPSNWLFSFSSRKCGRLMVMHWKPLATSHAAQTIGSIQLGPSYDCYGNWERFSLSVRGLFLVVLFWNVFERFEMLNNSSTKRGKISNNIVFPFLFDHLIGSSFRFRCFSFSPLIKWIYCESEAHRKRSKGASNPFFLYSAIHVVSFGLVNLSKLLFELWTLRFVSQIKRFQWHEGVRFESIILPCSHFL